MRKVTGRLSGFWFLALFSQQCSCEEVLFGVLHQIRKFRSFSQFDLMKPDENMMESRPTKRSILDVTHGISKRKRVELSCPICLRDFEDVAMIHPCCHIFCFGCISKWILQKSNCPLCKKHVDEIKHGFRVTRSSLGLEPKWTDRGEM